MDALIYTAMSGAETALRAQQVHANNLANLDTGGFRASLTLSDAQDLQSTYGYDDRHQSQLQANAVSVKPGPIKATGRDLDVAIAGSGFIAVDGPGGEAYTRAGAMNVNADGTLMLTAARWSATAAPSSCPSTPPSRSARTAPYPSSARARPPPTCSLSARSSWSTPKARNWPRTTPACWWRAAASRWRPTRPSSCTRARSKAAMSRRSRKWSPP